MVDMNESGVRITWMTGLLVGCKWKKRVEHTFDVRLETAHNCRCNLGFFPTEYNRPRMLHIAISLLKLRN